MTQFFKHCTSDTQVFVNIMRQVHAEGGYNVNSMKKSDIQKVFREAQARFDVYLTAKKQAQGQEA